MTKLISLEHPGIILQEEFIEPLELTAYKVSKATGISQTALGEIIRGTRNITSKTGLKLAKYFGLSDGYFMKLQMQYDLDLEKEEGGKALGEIIPFKPRNRNPPEEEELFEA